MGLGATLESEFALGVAVWDDAEADVEAEVDTDEDGMG